MATSGSRNKRGSARSRSRPHESDEPPCFGVSDLEHAYAEVQQLRQVSRALSPQEKKLRNDLRALIKSLDRQVRKCYDEKHVKDVRRARHMLNELDGVAVSKRSRVADAVVSKDWNETRDHSKPTPKTPAPRGGVRTIVSGGSPGLGKRR